MSFVMTVDPGSRRAGWAWWWLNEEQDQLRLELRNWGRLHKARSALEHYHVLRNCCYDLHETELVIEGQWYREPTRRDGQKEYHSAPFKRVLPIVEDRVRWMSAAEILGGRTTVVDPGEWIPSMTKGAPGETPDDRIRWVTKKRFPRIELIDDEHAAVLLGCYVAGLRGWRVR